MTVAALIFATFVNLALLGLLMTEAKRRHVHECAASEALEQLEHEANTGALDKRARQEAIRQRVEKHLHGVGMLTRGHKRALGGLYK